MNTITTLEEVQNLPIGTLITTRDNRGQERQHSIADGGVVSNNLNVPWSVFAEVVEAAESISVGREPRLSDLMLHNSGRYVDVVVDLLPDDERHVMVCRFREGQRTGEMRINIQQYPNQNFSIIEEGDLDYGQRTMRWAALTFYQQTRAMEEMRGQVRAQGDVAALREQAEGLQRQVNTAREQRDSLRNNVRDALHEHVENESIEEGDMASLDDVFRAAGVDWPQSPEVEFYVDARFRFVSRANERSRGIPSAAFVRDSLTVEATLDVDWDEQSPIDIEITGVSDPEEV